MSPIELTFPRLAMTGYKLTSSQDVKYNCIAWAASDCQRFWWPVHPPGEPTYWPPGAPRALTIPAFIAAYQSLGFQPCSDGSAEDGIEKIAIYAVGAIPKHAARQLANGRWTSKLGSHVDIEHALTGLEGAEYGVATQFMSRRRPAVKQSAGKKRRKQRRGS